MNILFLCNKSPWPPKEGGPMAMNMLVDGLSRAGHMVKVLAVNSFKYNIRLENIPCDYRERTGIELIEVDLKLRPVAAMVNLLAGRSYHVQRFISKPFRKRLTELLKDSHFDVVQLETLFMSPYIPVIRKYSGARVILRAHNIEHRIWERVAEETVNPFRRWYIHRLASSLRKYEHRILSSCDGIVAITPTDADYFRKVLGPGISVPEFIRPETSSAQTTSGIDGSLVNRPLSPGDLPPVIDIPFGVDPDNYSAENREMEFPSLFTLGSMNWIPNQDGIRWFLQNVWPDVHQQFPEMKYYLAGREMPPWMKNLEIPGIEVLGEIEDAGRFIASKAIMVVPLFSGSGIRIKIIEGMASGKTIITTSLGAEGIECTNREDILIANIPCEFFDMISIAAGNRALCEKIGRKARHLIETKYQSGLLIGKLAAFYEYLLR